MDPYVSEFLCSDGHSPLNRTWISGCNYADYHISLPVRSRVCVFVVVLFCLFVVVWGRLFCFASLGTLVKELSWARGVQPNPKPAGLCFLLCGPVI